METRLAAPPLAPAGALVFSAVQQQDYTASVWLSKRDKLEHVSTSPRLVSDLMWGQWVCSGSRGLGFALWERETASLSGYEIQIA